MGPVELQVLKAIIDHPGITVCEACRLLNGKDLRDCKACSDYLNTERKKRVRVVTPACRPRLGTVKKVITRLRRKRVIRAERRRAADIRMARGWDWVTRLYPDF